MNTTLPVPAVISSVRCLTSDVTLFTVQSESHHPVARSFQPGQFLELSLPGVGEIPISYCSYPATDGSIELCIRHVGHVTNSLKSAVVGDVVALRGPFGRGFPLTEYIGRDLVLIAGGLGIAPLRSLLLAIMMQRTSLNGVTLLYGARKPSSLIFLDDLQEMERHAELKLCLTVDHDEEGQHIFHAYSVSLLPALLHQLEVHPQQTSAALCGPPVVYPYLVSGLQQLGLGPERIYISLERRMKCGIGRCGHCSVGTLLCCVDGPVFSYRELAVIEGVVE